jgi:Vacuolar sorting protein 9 (VPS9) domain
LFSLFLVSVVKQETMSSADDTMGYHTDDLLASSSALDGDARPQEEAAIEVQPVVLLLEEQGGVPPPSALETTIQRMQGSSGMCFDPGHYHSFRSLMVPPMFQQCRFCQQRIKLVFLNDTERAVKCIACQAVAHRSCALLKREVVEEEHKCPVNYEIVKTQQQQQASSSKNANKTKEQIGKVDTSSATTTTSQPDQDPGNSNNSSNSTFSPESFPAMVQALQENVMNSYNREQHHHRRPRVAAAVARYPALRRNNNNRKSKKKSSSRTDPVAIKSAPSAENQKVEIPPVAETAAEDTANNNNNNSNNKNIAQHLADNINVGLLAGSLAGGVAGLALAGPAGAYAGYITAGGILVEGGVAWSLVAAGIGVGGLAGQQHHQKNRHKRVLELGGQNGSRTVLLVRPSVHVDPIWNKFYAEAQKSSAPSSSSQRKVNVHRDQDIYQTSESEIDTNDKILLLVNRTLNDKNSPSGHVFRHLVQVFHDRCQIRTRLCKTNGSIAGVSPRAKRDDVHAVIKFVTVSLMEERPELGLQAHFTELTATAVESLVFGLLYDAVFEEIVEETSSRDIDLWRKITTFEQQCRGARESLQSLVSETAVDALKLLPASHSTGEKLIFCVKFLDAVSEHFFVTTQHQGDDDDAAVIGADSLIKMVCQHLVLIGNSISCHAQVAFLEEFSRDEELLRGREGYALVTLQACLHVLQSSSDLQADVFYDENDSYSGHSVDPVVVHSGTDMEAALDDNTPGRCRTLSATDEDDVSRHDDSEGDGRADSTDEPLEKVGGCGSSSEETMKDHTAEVCTVTPLASGCVHGATDLEEEAEVFFDAEDDDDEMIAS